MKSAIITIIMFLLGHLPLRINHSIGGFLGWAAWLFPSSAKKVAMFNIAMCFPEKDAAWHHSTARKSFIETGKTFTEIAVLWHTPKSQIRKLMVGLSDETIFEQTICKRKGAILASPHLGCWEITGLYAALDYPLTSLYKKPRQQAIDRLIKRAREITGARLVPTTRGGIKQLYSALTKGECIGLLPDQEPGFGSGVFAPFFDTPAYTMTLLHRLAYKNKTPVLIVYAERLPKGKGFFMHAIKPDERIHDPDPVISATAMNETIEQLVRINPSQYMWSYKRFKKRPDGSEYY